jgi:hypothetical protein
MSLMLMLTHIGRYMTARLLSDKDLQLIRNFDKRPADTQDSLLKEVIRKTDLHNADQCAYLASPCMTCVWCRCGRMAPRMWTHC